MEKQIGLYEEYMKLLHEVNIGGENLEKKKIKFMDGDLVI